MTPSSRWYVVRTHARAEMKAQSHLVRQGFETYLPRLLKRRRHARKVETVAAPLFPRYLFVAIDLAAQRWRSIHSTIGVSHLVCTMNDPAAIPGAVIDALRHRESADGFVQLERRPRFAPGDNVRVTDGAFSDCIGLFEGMDDRERCAILLELLGRKVRVLLDEELVAAA